MKKLQKYSDLKVGDIVYIKPNKYASFILNYDNSKTMKQDILYLGENDLVNLIKLS